MHLLDRTDIRFVCLDIEASALVAGSYPIEVGLAIIAGFANPVTVWSQVIGPTASWLADGVWSPASQAVHGLSLAAVRERGAPVIEVAQTLNALLCDRAIVVSDAPGFDQAWLDTLFAAAGTQQAFAVQDIESLAGYLPAGEYRQFVHLLSRMPVPHRAGGDAFRLASSLVAARIGHPPVVVERAGGVSGYPA